MSHKSEMNKIRTLSAKEAAEYTKETGKKIPHLTSTLILIIFFFCINNSNNFRCFWCWKIILNRYVSLNLFNNNIYLVLLKESLQLILFLHME